MMSAEAGAMYPFNGDRYGRGKPRKQVATLEEHPEEVVAAMEEETDIMDGCDFSTMDDQTIAALYEEIATEDSFFEDPQEEDFLEGQ